MKNKNQVYICHSVFHLFVTLLKALTQRDKDFYVFVPNFLKFKPTVFVGKGIKELVVYSYQAMDKDWAEYKKTHPFSVFSYKKELASIIESHFDSERYKSVFKTSDFFVFNDGSPFVAYMMLTYKQNIFTLVEDGEAIYTELKKDIRYFLKRLSGYPLSFGHSSIINCLEVRFPERLPKITRNKSFLLPLSEMKNTLSLSQRNDLLSFFKVDAVKVDADIPSLLLLTQPLSEDGIVSEDYKISLYSKILAKYADGRKVFIKSHPREITDYSECFNDVSVLPSNSPVELFGFLDCRFDKAITLFSTSIHAVPADETQFLGLDYDSKVERSWKNYMGVKSVIK